MCVLQEVVIVAIVVRVAVAVIQIQLKFYQLHQAQANNKTLKINRVRKSDGIHSEVQNVCIVPNSFKQTKPEIKSSFTNTQYLLKDKFTVKKKTIVLNAKKRYLSNYFTEITLVVF